MIGRSGPVNHFKLVQWAREQARAKELRPSEAHVLLLLATRANTRGIAFPSIARLAEDAGFKVKTRRRTDRAGKARVSRECSAITAALGKLESKGLIWRLQRGRGQVAEIELLMPPAQTVAKTEPALTQTKGLPPAVTGHAPRVDGGRSTKKNQTSKATTKNQMMPPADAGGVNSHSRQEIRSAIRESLEEAQRP